MDDFFFVKLEELKFAERDEIPGLVKASEPWVQGMVLFYLCTQPQADGSATLVAVAADKLYFMDVPGGRAVSRLKCFHKRGMVAHALIVGSDAELPQIRIMMDNSLKLQFQLAECSVRTDAEMKKIAACAFFT